MKWHEKFNLETYAIDAQKCMRCGFCVVLCPIHDFSNWESESPRGRMQIIKGVLDGELNIGDVIKDRIFECTLCAYCKDKCPAGVRTVDSYRAIRRMLAKKGYLPNPIVTLDKSLNESYNIFNLPQEIKTDWIEYLALEDKIKIGGKTDLIYFIGCSTALSGRANSIAASTVSILNALDYNWAILGNEERCCGNPLFAAGKIDSVEEFVKHNVDAIHRSGAKTVITSCPGCFKTILLDYPNIVGNLGFEVLHTTQLVERALDSGKLRFQNRINYDVTYHDPCELGRYFGVYETPRRILENLPGIKFQELRYNRNLTQCCGAGGLMKATFPKLCLDQAERKLLEAKDAGAQIITSACQTCKLNIMDAISEKNSSLKVFDVMELVAHGLNIYQLSI